MLLPRLTNSIFAVALVVALLAGCEKDAPKPEAEHGHSHTNAEPSAKHEPADATAGGTTPAAATDTSKLSLDGLSFTVPEGWQTAPVGSGMFVAKAAFTLAGIDGDTKGVSVRITHYPEQKGKDDLNIARWMAQVRRPDGSAYTREQANVKITETGNIRVTVIDLAGSVATSMMGGGQATPNQRMIAAIVDHPRGPHIVKAVGSEASVARWEASIRAFLGSATVN